jgi:ArsR family transcriptional regulator
MPAQERPHEHDRRARFFGALADPTRLRFVELLAAENELTATQLAERSGVSLALAWHHVKVLRDAGIVTARKLGARTHYALARESLEAAFAGLTRPRLPARESGAGGTAVRVPSAYPVI